jgi:hypothetical protein
VEAVRSSAWTVAETLGDPFAADDDELGGNDSRARAADRLRSGGQGGPAVGFGVVALARRRYCCRR